MLKVVTLRCPGCGKTYSFNVGADAGLSTWRDIAARIADKKEAEKLNELLVKLSEKRGKAAMGDFTRNAAEVLNNIDYAATKADTMLLIDSESPEAAVEFFNDKAKESIAASAEKWATVAQREGLLAFEAMYICPKSRKVKQGLHVSVRYKDDKGGDNAYVCANKCDDCSSELVLLDDGNAGFMHEDCPTIAHCSDCGGSLVIDKVSFKLPQKEDAAANQ